MKHFKNLIKIGAFCIAVSGISAVTTSDKADARPNTSSYTCSGVKSLIQKRGAVVMNFKGRFVYRRFVANRSFCVPDETTRVKAVPTKSGKCRLKICEPRFERFGSSFKLKRN